MRLSHHSHLTMQKIYVSLIWKIQIAHAAKKKIQREVTIWSAEKKSVHTVEVQTTEVYKVEHIAAIKINITNVNRIYFNDL